MNATTQRLRRRRAGCTSGVAALSGSGPVSLGDGGGTIGSVVSTFLVSLGVMVVVVAFVTWLALRDADQRATTRRATVRERRAVAAPKPQAPAPPRPARASTRHRVAPRDVAAVYVPGGRARAGLALSVLAAFVGVIVALAIAGGVVFVAQGLRNSVR
jgi:hypothetical protein